MRGRSDGAHSVLGLGNGTCTRGIVYACFDNHVPKSVAKIIDNFPSHRSRCDN